MEKRAAALEDAGEVRAALADGLIGVDELGALVNGETAADGRTSVFRSVGMAIEDTAAAARALRGRGRRRVSQPASRQRTMKDRSNTMTVSPVDFVPIVSTVMIPFPGLDLDSLLSRIRLVA